VEFRLRASAIGMNFAWLRLGTIFYFNNQQRASADWHDFCI
jgi:hypothetical protein